MQRPRLSEPMFPGHPDDTEFVGDNRHERRRQARLDRKRRRATSVVDGPDPGMICFDKHGRVIPDDRIESVEYGDNGVVAITVRVRA